MRLLLDTHIAAWAILAPHRLSKSATRLLLDPDQEIWISDVSLWEIAVKRTLPRASSEGLPTTPEQAKAAFEEAGFNSLAIDYAHICTLAALPPLHGDPFDRLLVAQALTEPMRLLTHDRQVAQYSDTVILA